MEESGIWQVSENSMAEILPSEIAERSVAIDWLFRMQQRHKLYSYTFDKYTLMRPVKFYISSSRLGLVRFIIIFTHC